MNAPCLTPFDRDETASPRAPASETLSTPELCATLAQLCEAERETEWLLCRLLAELCDRFERRDPMLGAYADVYQLARLRFRMGVRRARERVRIGRALRGLPHIERAFVEGRLGYSRVREVTRVAKPEDEGHWLRLADELPQRALEQRVAEAGGGDERSKTNEPAALRWVSPSSLELRMTLPAAVWALLERAMEGARRLCSRDGGDAMLSDAEALEAVARDALARQSDGEDRGDVRQMVVLYRCQSCARSELETGAGSIGLERAEAERLACGSKYVELEGEGREVSHGGELPAAVRRAVLLRDRMRCRAPGCSRRRYVDVHHLVAREHGGEHSRKNCLCLCTACHARTHAGELRIEGDADGELRFYDASGAPLEQAPTTQLGHGAAAASSEAAGALLRVMGGRGGWHPDQLCEQSGLPISSVTRALLELELSGLVRSGLYGYEPAAAS